MEQFQHGLAAELQQLSVVIVEQGVARRLGPLLLEARDRREIPLPVIIALRGGASVTPWLRAGFDDHLVLPIETHQLRARLALTLQSRNRALSRLRARNAELEERNQQLSLARAEAEKASIAKSEFIANISHELRTPLHGILGSVEILKVRPGDAEQTELIEINGHSLLGLVGELLNYAALESGQTQLSRRAVELRKHLTAILDPIRARAQLAGLTFHDQIDPQLPLFVETDAQRFSQIVGNLLSNAVKFTQSGGVSFELRYREQSLVMTFEDSGIGIPDEQLSQVFQPFHQVESSSTRSFEGAGLGLAIVQRLVHALGGEIRLSSKLGVGSTFTVTLPAPAAASPQPKSDPGENVVTAEPSLSILVVEDNPINSRVMERLLQVWGHDPAIASSGTEALELLDSHSFDLVLMDVQMPGMNGLEATQRWRESETSRGLSPVPVIALTARTTERDRQVCLQSGMNDFLEKPPDHQRLRTLISTLAGRKPALPEV